MSKISPLAFIDPEAKIGDNCEIGPFCFIDKNVEIGDNNVLMNNVTMLYGARIGNGNIFFPGAVISAIPKQPPLSATITKYAKTSPSTAELPPKAKLSWAATTC